MQSNADKKMGMASTTKIMTALVALENSNPEDVVTISKNASYTEGSSLYLKEGEKIKMIDLLYGLMLNSGNDAAVAIAEHISGNINDFSLLMTQKAKDIGALNTNFVNPNGLSNENHYTTAYDLALITAKALENKVFSKIVSTESYKTKTLNTEHLLVFKNHNKLLNLLDNCYGVKTGFTKATGRCLVSTVTKSNWTAVCVTLNAPDDWNDHKKLYEYVYENYSLKKIASKDSVLKSIQTTGIINNGIVDVACKNDIDMVLNNSEHIRMDLSNVPDKISEPIKKGDSIGDVQFFLDDELVITEKAVSLNKMDFYTEKSFLDILSNAYLKWLMKRV